VLFLEGLSLSLGLCRPDMCMAASQEPTAAATEEGMQALVVSRETVPGAQAINKWRAQRGFAPLTVVVVDLVAESAAVPGGKVSSTALREQDAARLGQAADDHAGAPL
jgi:pantetheine-phosphate adenylyltransferase